MKEYSAQIVLISANYSSHEPSVCTSAETKRRTAPHSARSGLRENIRSLHEMEGGGGETIIVKILVPAVNASKTVKVSEKHNAVG